MQGGGVCNSGGSVTLVQCTVDHNSASGFLNEGTAVVTACTFSNNTGIAGGGMEDFGPASVTNCTFSNNAIPVGNGVGGALYVGPSGGVGSTLTMTNCTIANNAARGSGGGICIDSSSTLNLINTIVAENTAAASGPDVYGTINKADHNLIGDISGGTILTDQGGNLLGGNGNPVIDPRLGPLASHGGPTQTLSALGRQPGHRPCG